VRGAHDQPLPELPQLAASFSSGTNSHCFPAVGRGAGCPHPGHLHAVRAVVLTLLAFPRLWPPACRLDSAVGWLASLRFAVMAGRALAGAVAVQIHRYMH